jgi:hypothetical protein
MKYLSIVILITTTFISCIDDSNLYISDVHTGWDKDALSDIITDISTNQRYYEYSCSEIQENVVSVEGEIRFTGDVPDTARLSVAVTTKPPPGMPTCYFTVKTKKFPFGFRFTNLERDKEVYIMAVLKMDGASIPIPQEGVDYYGDAGKTPIKLSEDIKDIVIELKLYHKE